MILADTSIWIEFLKQVNPISSLMRAHLEEQNIVATEWIFGELLQGARNRSEIEIITEYGNQIKLIHAPGLWIQAGQYSASHRLLSKGIGLIDVAILLAARHEKAKVWTLDKKLKSILKRAEIYQQA